MKFIHQKDGSMNIIVDDEDDYEFLDNNGVDVVLSRVQVEELFRSRPAPSPKSGCDGCRKDIEHLDCPTPGNCDQMKCPICCEGSDFPTLPEEIKKYEDASATQAREDELTNLQDWRDEQMNIFPFDPWVFIYRENKRISHLLKSLRTEAHK